MSANSITRSTSNYSRKFCLLAVAVVFIAPVLIFKRHFFPTYDTNTRSSSLSCVPDHVEGVKMSAPSLLATEIPKDFLSKQKSVKVQEKYQEVQVRTESHSSLNRCLISKLLTVCIIGYCGESIKRTWKMSQPGYSILPGVISGRFIIWYITQASLQ